MTEKWKAHINGSIGQKEVEISCIHTSDKHGQISWGWGGSTKFILFDTELDGLKKKDRVNIHNTMMSIASSMADSLNIKHKNGLPFDFDLG